jgi:hypothetical protein
MRTTTLRWTLWLAVGLCGCATVVQSAAPVGDGTAYVVGSKEAFMAEPTVWRCPAVPGPDTKCTRVRVVGVAQ